MDLQGKVAWVTGGGQGIGASIAAALARAGADVAVCARTLSKVEAVAAELEGAGVRALALTCDVTDQESVQSAFERTVGELGPVDILVNNAGTSSSAPLARVTLEEWNRVMAVNATGTFLATRAAVPGMVERGWGRVISVASVAARVGARYISAYTASKHALLGFTRCVAAEVAGTGVTANAICPGYVDTPMTRASVENIMSRTGRSEEQSLAAILETSAQTRLVTPEEVAHLTLSLCADEAGSVNAQALVVDGGAFLG